MKVNANGAVVKVMSQNAGVGWRWPKHTDQLQYPFSNIVGKLLSTAVMSFVGASRGTYKIDTPHLANYGR